MSEVYTVYGKVDCPQCGTAKMLLEKSGYSYNYLQLDKDYTKEQLVDINPHVRFLPVILLGERFIGGLTQLKNHLGDELLAS